MDMTAPYSLGVIVQPAAVSALIARQKQPTALILLCDGGCDCGHNVLSFFQRIHADPPHITQLSFLPAPYQQQAFQSKIRLKPTYSGYYGSPGYSDYESGYSDYNRLSQTQSCRMWTRTRCLNSYTRFCLRSRTWTSQ